MMKMEEAKWLRTPMRWLERTTMRVLNQGAGGKASSFDDEFGAKLQMMFFSIFLFRGFEK